MSYLTIDRAGLRSVTDPLSIFPEVIANTFDAKDVSDVYFLAEPVRNRSRVKVTVIDNAPEGWANLDHAVTMYAPSTRRDDAAKRGRFNRGEKCFLAYVEKGTLETMSGTLEFNGDEMERHPRRKTDLGTTLKATVIMDRETFGAAMEVVHRIVPPKGVTFQVNGGFINRPRVSATVEVTLGTVLFDGEALRPTRRQCEIEIWPSNDGKCWIYEMGIPVVEVEGDYHVNVGQKVPLNVNRDNVTPAYLRELRAHVLDAMVTEVAPERLAAAWVADALPKVADTTLTTTLDRQYGKDRVAFTPGEPESNTRATAAGFTVVPANAITGAARQRAKDLGALPSSASMFSTGRIDTSPDGVAPIPVEQWTDHMENIATYAMALAEHLGVVCRAVQWYPREAGLRGAWSGNVLSLNISVVGDELTRLDALLIHEFGHSRSANHFSDEYFQALCHFGARMRGWERAV